AALRDPDRREIAGPRELYFALYNVQASCCWRDSQGETGSDDSCFRLRCFKDQWPKRTLASDNSGYLAGMQREAFAAQNPIELSLGPGMDWGPGVLRKKVEAGCNLAGRAQNVPWLQMQALRDHQWVAGAFQR